MYLFSDDFGQSCRFKNVRPLLQNSLSIYISMRVCEMLGWVCLNSYELDCNAFFIKLVASFV